MVEQLTWVCAKCGSPVSNPGYLGRSWCPKCESYEPPTRAEPAESEPAESEQSKYVFTTWRPQGHKYMADETPEHRFMFVKRRNILAKGTRALSYKAKCTCGKWRNGNGFTSRRRAHVQWEAHMAEVEKQGNLFPIAQQ